MPRFNATSFIFALNMGADAVSLNLAAAMGRAGLGAATWASPLTLVLDSDGVATRAGERLDSTAVAVPPWGAVVAAVHLDAHPDA